MESQIHNRIHGWSQLGIVASDTTNEPTTINLQEAYLLYVLDRFASLLVFQPGEEAAAAAWRSPDSLRILWTKNVQVTSNDITYVRRLVDSTTAESKVEEALRVVISACKARICQCAQELAQAFGPIQNRTNLWHWNENFPAYRDAGDKLETALNWPNDEIAERLDNFIKISADLEDQTEECILKILLTAGVLITEISIKEFISVRRLRPLQQLGVYYVAVDYISEELKKLEEKGIKIETEHASSQIRTRLATMLTSSRCSTLTRSS